MPSSPRPGSFGPLCRHPSPGALLALDIHQHVPIGIAPATALTEVARARQRSAPTEPDILGRADHCLADARCLHDRRTGRRARLGNTTTLLCSAGSFLLSIAFTRAGNQRWSPIRWSRCGSSGPATSPGPTPSGPLTVAGMFRSCSTCGEVLGYDALQPASPSFPPPTGRGHAFGSGVL